MIVTCNIICDGNGRVGEKGVQAEIEIRWEKDGGKKNLDHFSNYRCLTN